MFIKNRRSSQDLSIIGSDQIDHRSDQIDQIDKIIQDLFNQSGLNIC